jgi:DNA repair exonuclease SbcCD ATPase subunit
MEKITNTSRLEEIVQWLNNEKLRYDSFVSQLKYFKNSKQENEKKLETMLKAKSVLVEVQDITLRKYKEIIEGLVTMALNTVFDRPYRFNLTFQKKREIVECHMTVQEGDQEPEYPKDDSGVGLIDMISFALRVVIWGLDRPRKRPIFYLDEPFKALGDGEDLRKATETLSKIAKDLGIQLIINTHSSDIAARADRAWNFVYDGRTTSVSLITDNELKTQEKKVKRVRL